MKSNTQQSILKQRHGTEARECRRGVGRYLYKQGQCATNRWTVNFLFGSTEPMENIVYYDDLADHDFPDDSEMSLDDSAVLSGMEVRDEEYLDAYFDVTS
ncbi:hypothetical protein R1sor_007752 [Riccia sorocarpa]|uniref:Uncharacterized protein n=1 Tax=Riccia sorocarpa TaxID=122646 RepID=A0ABD3HTJ1_9MARC